MQTSDTYKRAHGCALQLVEKTSVFRQFTGFVRYALFLATLETAQNRKVWASRAKPVLPANYKYISFFDSLKGCALMNIFYCVLFLYTHFCIQLIERIKRFVELFISVLTCQAETQARLVLGHSRIDGRRHEHTVFKHQR